MAGDVARMCSALLVLVLMLALEASSVFGDTVETRIARLERRLKAVEQPGTYNSSGKIDNFTLLEINQCNEMLISCTRAP